jgi:two-component system phosphate regulon response regulator PhoB
MTERLQYQSIKLIERDLYLNGNAQPIRLRPKEAQLLAALLRKPNKTVSRVTLMKEVWETDFLDDTRTLDVHVRWLREKIEENPSRPRRLLTVRGLGYCLVVGEKNK